MHPTPISESISRLRNAVHDAVESAAHPSSKPHKEANRALQKCLIQLARDGEILLKGREQQWVSVTTRLPDADLLVLIALNDDDVWTGYRDGDIWRYVDAMPITGERVTHWMPMPAPPTRSAA